MLLVSSLRSVSPSEYCAGVWFPAQEEELEFELEEAEAEDHSVL